MPGFAATSNTEKCKGIFKCPQRQWQQFILPSNAPELISSKKQSGDLQSLTDKKKRTSAPPSLAN